MPTTTTHAPNTKPHIKTTARHLAVLIIIADRPHKLSELARKIGISTAAITGTADRLEKLGMATRITTKDRRIQLLEITETALQHLTDLCKANSITI